MYVSLEVSFAITPGRGLNPGTAGFRSQVLQSRCSALPPPTHSGETADSHVLVVPPPPIMGQCNILIGNEASFC